MYRKTCISIKVQCSAVPCAFPLFGNDECFKNKKNTTTTAHTNILSPLLIDVWYKPRKIWSAVDSKHGEGRPNS